MSSNLYYKSTAIRRGGFWFKMVKQEYSELTSFCEHNKSKATYGIISSKKYLKTSRTVSLHQAKKGNKTHQSK